MLKEKNTKDAVLSFRTSKDNQKKVDREAKKRKITRAEFMEQIFFPAFETVIQKQIN